MSRPVIVSEARLIELAEMGLTAPQIAERMGLNERGTYARLKVLRERGMIQPSLHKRYESRRMVGEPLSSKERSLDVRDEYGVDRLAAALARGDR